MVIFRFKILQNCVHVGDMKLMVFRLVLNWPLTPILDTQVHKQKIPIQEHNTNMQLLYRSTWSKKKAG